MTGPDPISTGTASHPGTGPYFDQALALAVQHGWITQRGSDLTAGAVPPTAF